MLIVCYVRIIYFVWKERRSVREGMEENQFNLVKRTTVLVTLVVTIYIFTTVPGAIYLATVLLLPGEVTKSQIHILGIVSLIYYCNSNINPIFYASRIPVFKEACCKIFRRVSRIVRNQTNVLRVCEVNRVESRNSQIPLEPRRDVEI